MEEIKRFKNGNMHIHLTKDTFWNDVRKMTRNVHSDHVIGIWQCLAEVRFNELIGKEEA